MDFSFTDEQDAVGDLTTQILTDRSAPDVLRTLERSGEPRIDRSTWAELAKAGVLGIAVPESAGGAGLGLVELGRILQAAGKTAAAVPLWSTLALGALPVAEFGSPELQQTWLTKVVDGTAVLTAAWHEDVADPLDPEATAGSGDGGHTVTGEKICVPAGLIADAAVVPARLDGQPALFLVDLHGPGVTVVGVDTTAGSPDANLVFDLAPATLLATGAEALEWAYERAVAAQCAFALGVCETALALTAEYTIDRKQFDVPIASFQAVGHRAADTFIDTQTIRLTTWQALTRLAEGLPATLEVSVAKYWAAFSGQRLSLATVHLHGGVGVDRDYPLHRYFLALKEVELQLGGATQHLLRVGRDRGHPGLISEGTRPGVSSSPVEPNARTTRPVRPPGRTGLAAR